MSKLLRLALAAAIVVPAAGCSSSDDFQDAVAMINPFGDNKKPLSGERVAVVADQSTEMTAKGKPVSVGAPRAVATWTGAGGPAGNDSGNVALNGSGTSRVWTTRAAEVGSGSMLRADVRAFARPVSAAGRVFVLDPSGNVTAVTLAGGVSWHASVRPADIGEPATTGGLATDGARVYVATAYGNVVALDADSGAKVWEKPLPEPARGAPTVADGRLYVATQAGNVLSLAAADGAPGWTFRGVPEIGNVLSSANPAVAAGVVVVPFTSGEVVAIDTKTGNALWTDSLTRAGRNYAVSGLTTIAASPVISDGVAYVAGVGSRTLAIQLKTGARLWDVPLGTLHTPVVAGNALFAVDLDDNLTAIERRTGEVLWATKLPVTKTKKKHSHWAGPLLAGGSLWLVSSDGGMIAVDAVSGRVTATQGGNDPAMISPIAVGGRLLVLSGNGNLTAFE